MIWGNDECVAPPGQRMCACTEYREWQRAIIHIQDQRIRDLERRLAGQPITTWGHAWSEPAAQHAATAQPTNSNAHDGHPQ